MEKQLVNPYEKEFMKMAMLKHEQTFKEQVCELHRLYQIQKILMRNIESINGPNNSHSQERRWMNSKFGTTGGGGAKSHQTITFSDRDLQQKKPQRKLDLEQPAEEYIEEVDYCNNGNNGVVEIEEDGGEGEIELTLGLTSYNSRRREQKLGDQYHQTPLTSDSGPSSSSSTGSTSHMKKTNSSRSAGTQQRGDRSTRKELNNSSQQWGGLVQNDQRRNSTTSAFQVVEEPLRQERLKQPPWLLQALSLNMT